MITDTGGTRRCCFLAVFLTCILSVYGEIVIKHVEREIGSLPTKLMQRSQMTVVNDQKSEVKTFSVCARAEDMEATAIIQVGEVGDDVDKNAQFTLTGEKEGTPAGITCYNYDFAKPLKHKETRKLVVLHITTNHLQAYPKERKQSESPKVLVTIPETTVSCYPIEEEESYLMLTTTQMAVKKAGLREFEQDKQKLQFGTQKNVPKYSDGVVKVQVGMNHAILRARSVERDIHVSHWGHVRVKEVYDITNLSPGIKGEFSRLATMMNPEKAMLGAAHTLKAKVPAAAYDIRYRDEIGNISTSHMATSGSWIALALDPRFPIFGGWSVHFMLEYSLGLDAVVEKKSFGQYSASFLSLPAIAEITYDHIETRLHLPSGAKLDPQTKITFPGSFSVSTEYTYLSVLPSPVLTIKQENVVTDMSTVAVFNYGYQDILVFEKPVVAFVSLIGVIACIAAISSVDLGYSTKKAKIV